MLQRLLEVKQGLEETVVARAWKEWLEGQLRALKEEADNIKSTVSAGQSRSACMPIANLGLPCLKARVNLILIMTISLSI
jgi:hypothetical protein